MITITLHNEETGAYVDGILEFDEDGEFGTIEAFITGVEPGITIRDTYEIYGAVEITCADVGNRKEEQ